MREYRCFVPGNWQEGDLLPLPEEEAHHLVRVLRASVGSEVLMMDGRGSEFRAELVRVERRGVTVRLAATVRSAPSPKPRWLACALTKSSHFEDMLQRAVELGMTAFFPLVTDRTEVDYDARRASRKRERWQRLAAEALKQCERLWLPEFHLPLGIRDHIGLAREHGVLPLPLLERSGPEGSIAPLTPEAGRHEGGICLYVGPEGGWSPEEREFLLTHSEGGCHLGTEAILRTETAALSALARLMG